MSQQTYAPLRTSFWTDPDVRTSLPQEARYLLLYYISSPHSNMIGLYTCPYAYAARETDLTVEEVRLHTQITLVPYVTYDESTEEVYVHGAAKHRVGLKLKPDDKRIGTITRLWMDCHSPYLRAAFCDKYREWGFFESTPTIPEGYRLVAPPLPVRGIQAPSKPLSRRSEVSSAVADQIKTETPTSDRAKKKKGAMPTYSVEFLEVWALHGRGAKATAFAEYKRAVEGEAVTHEQILAALSRYVRAKVRPDFDGVHLFRWLRDARWEEEISDAPQAPRLPGWQQAKLEGEQQAQRAWITQRGGPMVPVITPRVPKIPPSTPDKLKSKAEGGPVRLHVELPKAEGFSA